MPGHFAMDFLLQTQSKKLQRDILVTYVIRQVSTWDTSFQIWPDNDKGSLFLQDKVTQHLGALPKREKSPDLTRRFSYHIIVLIVRESPHKEEGPRVPEEKTIFELSVLDVATRRVYLDLVGFQGWQLPAHQNITTITEESVDIKQSRSLIMQ